MRGRFNKVDDRFDEVDDRFDDLEGHMDSRFASIDSRFNDLEGRMDQVDVRYEEMSDTIDRGHEQLNRNLTKYFRWILGAIVASNLIFDTALWYIYLIY